MADRPSIIVSLCVCVERKGTRLKIQFRQSIRRNIQDNVYLVIFFSIGRSKTAIADFCRPMAKFICIRTVDI